MYSMKSMPKLKSDDKSIMNQILKEEAFFINQKQGDIHSFVLDDDSDRLLDKLLNIHKMANIDKENYTKHISYCIRQLGQKAVDKFPLIIEKYKSEDERVQIMFIEQINLIYEAMPRGQPQEQVISILSYFLLNSILKIKESAGVQLTRIALHLQGDEKGNLLLPIIIKMAHDDSNEDNRVVALQLMGKLSSMFGIQLSESFIAFEVMSLGEDSKPTVRKEAVSQLPPVSKVVGKEFFNKKLFPFYLTKCKENNQKVRTACVEHFLQIVELSSQQQKTTELTAQILQFQSDSNKSIKGVAFRCLARFIAAIDKDKVEPKLFENYLRMADSDIRDLLNDQQVLFACAFGFPAVLQTVGPARWPQMQKLFNQLWKQKNERICKTLAASLHEVAKIIGAERAEMDLFPVLENIFVKEPNDNVLMGCVKNLSQFLKIFSDEKKESLLEIFFFIQKDQKKWRIRESIANQLEDMAQIFPSDIVFKMIVPIGFKLCTDQVAHVRKIASQKIFSFFHGVKDSVAAEQYKVCLVENIIGFQKSSVFYQRQSFINMCSKIMNTEESIFEESLLNPLIELAKDKVGNVRYLLYVTLENHVAHQGKYAKNEKILNALIDLANDAKVKALVKYQQKIFETQDTKQQNIIQQAEPIQQQEIVNEEPQLEELDDIEIPERHVKKEPEILQKLREEKQKFIEEQEKEKLKLLNNTELKNSPSDTQQNEQQQNEIENEVESGPQGQGQELEKQQEIDQETQEQGSQSDQKENNIQQCDPQL